MATLTSEYQQILTSQTIDTDGPGSILRDFEMLLEWIGPEGTTVSHKNNLLPMKSLEQLNARMTHPLQLALKRPRLKSYPHISALYMLLRATGLASVKGTGTTKRLVLDETLLASWRQLNPTERYFTLLETGLLRAKPEMIGERGFGMRPLVDKWGNFFQRIPGKGLRIAGNKRQEDVITYIPGFLAVAMLELFGLITVHHGKPKAGKGWCIVKVDRTPWGDALLHVLAEHLMSIDFLLRLDTLSEEPFGALQAILQPFFPAWCQNLHLPEPEFHDGTFIFKVSWGRVWRRIAIPGTHQMDRLSDAILAAYEFDHDHLYLFSYTNRFGLATEINHPYTEDPPLTTEVRIGEVPLQPGETMTYVYDFGDHWEFEVQLERIDPVDRRMRKYKILESHGEAPEQYEWGDWDGDWDAEDNGDL